MTMMATYVLDDRNQDATVYVGNLDERVTETILWELFLQGGPVVSVHLPKDRVSYLHQGFGFVEFVCEEDADYCIKIMNMIKLYGKPIRVNKASTHQKNLDIGANIFVGNLDTDVDEKLLYDTFSAFGVILQTPKIMRDYQIGTSKGFAFINYGSFEASDAAIDAMNGQFLCNRPITVSYAYKKDSRGERHGSAAERILAMQNPLSSTDKPHQKFADVPINPNAQNPPNKMPAPPVSNDLTQMPYLPSNRFPTEQTPTSFPTPPSMGQMPPPQFGMPPPPGMSMPPGMPPPPGMQMFPGMPNPSGMQIPPSGMPPPPGMQMIPGMPYSPGMQMHSGMPPPPGMSIPPTTSRMQGMNPHNFPPPHMPFPPGLSQPPNMQPRGMPPPPMNQFPFPQPGVQDFRAPQMRLPPPQNQQNQNR